MDDVNVLKAQGLMQQQQITALPQMISPEQMSVRQNLDVPTNTPPMVPGA
jgi:hypothetical protein